MIRRKAALAQILACLALSCADPPTFQLPLSTQFPVDDVHLGMTFGELRQARPEVMVVPDSAMVVEELFRARYHYAFTSQRRNRAPEQVRVILIGADAGEAARAVAERMGQAGLRVGLHPRAAEVDFREEIKDASHLKVPYMAIVGRREARDGTVSLRARGAKKRQVTLPVDEAVARLRRESEGRMLWGAADTMEAAGTRGVDRG